MSHEPAGRGTPVSGYNLMESDSVRFLVIKSKAEAKNIQREKRLYMEKIFLEGIRKIYRDSSAKRRRRRKEGTCGRRADRSCDVLN